ncbi:BZIP domain-containing protein [Plasmodiophora brassicae]|uniref:BZIP domain-containing protein n=2 Tax=Plasmodiophora brassicae TaxID=37360 RepID=A0A3P3YBY2_PLABS|nr:unnamed protein product [Plasmodiophora brassicae]
MSANANPFDLISQEIGIPSSGFASHPGPFGFGRPPTGMPMDLIPDLPPMPMRGAGIHQIIHGPAPPKKGRAASARKGDLERIEKRRKREREAAARSRQRKADLIGTLELQVSLMKAEIKTLKEQVIALGGTPPPSQYENAPKQIAAMRSAQQQTQQGIHHGHEDDFVSSSNNSSPSSAKRGSRLGP